MEHQKISVVIPCFNEGKTIYQNIKKISEYLVQNFSDFEIIVVNDGSTDNTLSELRIVKQEVPLKIINNEQNEGKGKAVRDGILASSNEIVMFLDADLAIPIEELGKFMEELKKGNDIVIASRFIPGLKILRPVLWYRKIMERIFRALRMIMLNSWKVKDTQCGFKVFRKEVAQRIFSMATINRFAFDAEIIFVAKKFGYQIKELPISLQNPPKSHVRIFRDSINMFFSLIKIRFNDLNGIYKWKQKVITEKN
ncbi:MAG: glycosyltransferase [Candidatus Moranbacteria bacterium]|nr:glycosyltransferase [Candidatus Moranbacteria bacterium]